MPRHLFRPLAAAFFATLIHAFAPGFVRDARAQDPCSEDPALCAPPTVTITPASRALTGSTLTVPVAVTIEWCGDAVNLGTRKIRLNGADVTAQFQHATSGVCAPSTATLTLGDGTHTLDAEVSNLRGDVGSDRAVYTYDAPEPASVRVTPGAEGVRRAAGQGAIERFTVSNPGGLAATFTLQAACTGAAIGCAPTRSSITLPGGGSTLVGITYSASSTVGAAGTVRLRAIQSGASAVRDSGTYTLATAALPPSGMPGDGAAGAIVERGACLTIAAGSSAAYECGDLRLAHALPGVRLLSRARAPVLLYNSQHARPHPIVAAAYSPPGIATPQTVRLDLAVTKPGGAATHSATFAGWAPGEARRLAVGFDAADLPTGLYAYTLSAVATYAGGTTNTASLGGGTIVVVNRSSVASPNPFGAGWWLAGLEQLHAQANGDWLWVGGDGSARLYHRLNASTWVADPFDGPDTLRHVSGRFVRTLPGRVEVRFDSGGRHVETVSKLGHRTGFVWTGDQLTRIDLPVSGYSYTFGYNLAGRMNRVTSPGPSSSRVTRSTLPTNSSRSLRTWPGWLQARLRTTFPFGSITNSEFGRSPRACFSRLSMGSTSHGIVVPNCLAACRACSSRSSSVNGCT